MGLQGGTYLREPQLNTLLGRRHACTIQGGHTQLMASLSISHYECTLSDRYVTEKVAETILEIWFYDEIGEVLALEKPIDAR